MVAAVIIGKLESHRFVIFKVICLSAVSFC